MNDFIEVKRYLWLFSLLVALYLLVHHIASINYRSTHPALELPLHHKRHPNLFIIQNISRREKCFRSIFYVGQQKSGSQTVHHLLRMVQKDNPTQYSRAYNAHILQRDGECDCRASGLIRASDDFPWCRNCEPEYFTVFREPLSRLISAYNYCKDKGKNDPLCAYNEPIGKICDFAKMWGSYQFDKFLTVPFSVDPRVIHEYGRHWCPSCPLFNRTRYRIRQSTSGALYRSVVYTNKLMLAHYHLNDPSTKQGRLHLKRVIESLKMSFGAIGILEHWQDTLRVLYAFTGCKVFLSGQTLKQNAAAHPMSESADNNSVFTSSIGHTRVRIPRDLEKCLPDVMRWIDPDIRIYNEAVNIFKAQLVALNYSAMRR